MSNVKYVGMDVHKAITVIVVLNALGHMESHSKVKTKAENICDFFRGLSGKVEVVFEEGTHSAWLHKLIKPLVASVTVCDPRHNKLIEDGNKSDDDDAETLAQLLRIGAVKAVYKGDDEGSVAKIGWGGKKPGPDFSLGGNLEEALHESYLSANVAFPDSFNLALPYHVRDLISADGPPRRLETEESESGIDSPFDEPMVLLDYVIEVFALSELRGHG